MGNERNRRRLGHCVSPHYDPDLLSCHEKDWAFLEGVCFSNCSCPDRLGHDGVCSPSGAFATAFSTPLFARTINPHHRGGDVICGWATGILSPASHKHTQDDTGHAPAWENGRQW